MDLAECERNINDVKIINTTVLKNKRSMDFRSRNFRNSIICFG